MKKQQEFLQLTAEHHSCLTSLMTKGSLNVRVARRISGLLQLNQGLNLNRIANSLGVAYQTVAVWRNKYRSNGLDFLRDKAARSGRPIITNKHRFSSAIPAL